MTGSPSQPGPKWVLVADDEHLVASGICGSLRALRMEVVGPFADGAAAIAGADSGQGADLALLDIRMPGQDGLEIARCLWDRFALPSIIVSAYSDQSYVERAQQTGVFGYLLKPVTTESLRVAISVAWARFETARAADKRIQQLELSIAHRRKIEQAKWKIVEREGKTEAEAHNHLQRKARDERRKLIDVAEDVLRHYAN